MFLHLSVSHSVHMGCLPQCMLGYTPPRPDTLPGQTPHPPQQTTTVAKKDSYWNAFLLPPATKLGQGYIFTGICDFCPQGRGACSRGVPAHRGACSWGLCLFPGVPAPGGWVLPPGGLGGAWLGGLLGGGGWWRPPGTATAAGGTLPTGMHFCYLNVTAKGDTYSLYPNFLNIDLFIKAK